jgi:energy-coupling factor transporter ATP-binding protein EcfA2
MPEQASRLPAALPASEQLAEFKRYSIAHRILKEADNNLWQRIQEPGGASLIFVYGPTGVGKTTLRQHITSRLIEAAEGALESESHQLPVLALEAAAPESGNFHWGHFFRQALGELEAPFLKDKVEYAANTAYFDRAGNYVINLRATAQDLRLSVEQSLRYRRPRAVIIDEAQHLTKISSGRRLQEQMDVLKSLANQTGSLLVLIGTYELLTFQGLSGQLSRRSVSVHFPRYGSGAEDLKAFQSVVYGFQRRLPVKEEPDLLKHWEYCYVRSIGCVGILKDWLVRALGVSLAEGGRTVRMRHLEDTALSVWQCEQIARETLAGEERLEEKPGSMSRLTEMLGLVVQRMAAPAAGDGPPAEAGEVAVEKKAEKPRSKRRVGQRKPKRDPLT